MVWLWVLVGLLVILGSVLAMAETSVSRMSRVRSMALREAGRRHADLLERIQEEPTRYLNGIYLCVMFVQNGSAILVAILVELAFGEVAVTYLSVVFTLAYFVVVEAMSKTFGILHSDAVALRLAPVVWAIGRALNGPTRLLIGLANVLLPGKGLKEGPFVSPEDIRSMVEVGREEGTIEERERTLIHSIFEIGHTRVREVMVPRPDMISVPVGTPISESLDLMLAHGHWRLPVYRGDRAEVVGVIYAEDLLRRLRANDVAHPVDAVMHEPIFVPETKDVSALLREMQQRRIHIAMVVDEHGSVIGLVTLEDLLEELVGEITDEYDEEERTVERLEDGRFRLYGSLPVNEVGRILGIELPPSQATTLAGLVSDLLGAVPEGGETVRWADLEFTVEEVKGRRIASVVVSGGEWAQEGPKSAG